ncbi:MULTISPECIES: HNH endonuclease [Delftia]|uniref:HNH endonuclease n=1 Tax=Delftia TaxID=80865 RepID=UPI00062D09DF|nr:MULTISPECIES: HNH endonuclease [Delftia]MDH0422179.1 HNH endonuclease [Delftia tsuruhatensis]OJX21505.1 MAG: restriction endonuclease [Delftia sp. 67-8]QFS66587.1 HNH endonuclease [Delftia tsuruhatensis]WON88116.1 HNH endonuclease [Delftia sp. UGAL515B_04]
MRIVAKFYETYSICDFVSGLLKDTFDHAPLLEGFHCDQQWSTWLAPYAKHSMLHQFISFAAQILHSEQAEGFDIEKQKAIYANFKSMPLAIADLKPHKLPIEHAFEYHGIDHLTLFTFLKDKGKNFENTDANDIYEYMNEIWMSAAYEDLIKQTVDEVFHVLFQNRELMMNFNSYLSGILEMANWDEAETLDRSLLSTNGKIARVSPPMWAKRAVFFRDRGCCVFCERDLTGLMNIDNVGNYDHIVSLSNWGLNDITNLQLLCVSCNQHDKRDGPPATSRKYQSWYSMDE